MKTKWFIVYLVIIGIGAIWLGYRKYERYENDKKLAAEQHVVAAPNATDKLIAQYQEELATSPKEPRIMVSLAGAYVQKARETSDASYYDKIDDLMNQAEAIDPNNADIYDLRGSVALSRHHFVDALALGQKAVVLSPEKAASYGIVVDAQTELGHNDEAVDALQQMVDKRPDYSSYSRIAYARELHGDFDGARIALQTAISAGSTFPENIAWGYVELGKLDFRSDLDAATTQFNHALAIDPNYAPAYEQLGRVAFAKNDIDGAKQNLQKAFDLLPLAQYAIDLGELYTKTGDIDMAAQQYELARITFDKSTAGGVDADMELSLFLSEHDLDLSKSLDLAQQSYKVRGSVYGADALAWAYYKNNQPQQAQQYITQALRLGQNDPSIVFHAAQIAEQNGDAAGAKTLYAKVVSLSPHFSIVYDGIAQSKSK